jgi:hypothetical protein
MSDDHLFSSVQAAVSERPLYISCALLKAMTGLDPQNDICHDRAKSWVAQNEGWSVVEGWLQESQCSFVKHSMVRDPALELICVTAAVRSGVAGHFVEHCANWSTDPFDSLCARVWARVPDMTNLADDRKTLPDDDAAPTYATGEVWPKV